MCIITQNKVAFLTRKKNKIHVCTSFVPSLKKIETNDAIGQGGSVFARKFTDFEIKKFVAQKRIQKPT